MKTIASIVLFAALSFQCNAQNETLPMIEEGRIYNVVSLVPDSPPEGEPGPNIYQHFNGGWYHGLPHNYIIKGDSLVGGKTYKRYMDLDDNVCFRLLRQDGDKVYMRFGDDQYGEYLLFDFGLKVGEILPGFISSNGLRVEKIDTVCINGYNRKRMAMSIYDTANPESNLHNIIDYWIEGIGCIEGPADTFWWEMIGLIPMVVTCYQGEELLFGYKDYVAPSITSNIYNTTSNDNDSGPAFDIQGRKFADVQERGIVVRNGKKILQQ